jgi:hypothetical protein
MIDVDEFFRAGTMAGPASMGHGLQGPDKIVNSSYGRLGESRVILLKIVLDVL